MTGWADSDKVKFDGNKSESYFLVQNHSTEQTNNIVNMTSQAQEIKPNKAKSLEDLEYESTVC